MSTPDHNRPPPVWCAQCRVQYTFRSQYASAGCYRCGTAYAATSEIVRIVDDAAAKGTGPVSIASRTGLAYVEAVLPIWATRPTTTQDQIDSIDWSHTPWRFYTRASQTGYRWRASK